MTGWINGFIRHCRDASVLIHVFTWIIAVAAAWLAAVIVGLVPLLLATMHIPPVFGFSMNAEAVGVPTGIGCVLFAETLRQQRSKRRWSILMLVACALFVIAAIRVALDYLFGTNLPPSARIPIIVFSVVHAPYILPSTLVAGTSALLIFAKVFPKERMTNET